MQPSDALAPRGKPLPRLVVVSAEQAAVLLFATGVLLGAVMVRLAILVTAQLQG